MLPLQLRGCDHAGSHTRYMMLYEITRGWPFEIRLAFLWQPNVQQQQQLEPLNERDYDWGEEKEVAGAVYNIWLKIHLTAPNKLYVLSSSPPLYSCSVQPMKYSRKRMQKRANRKCFYSTPRSPGIGGKKYCCPNFTFWVNANFMFKLINRVNRQRLNS